MQFFDASCAVNLGLGFLRGSVGLAFGLSEPSAPAGTLVLQKSRTIGRRIDHASRFR